MAARRRRTSIRTAPKAVQQRFREQLAELREDPARVVPECPEGEPRPIARIRKRLERMREGKPGLLDRRDRSIVGAVANSLLLADQESFPRLLDAKVAGQRRFFLQRGHADRMAMLGVQNHDRPRALLAAFRPLAPKHGLHFFAGPRFWCTGAQPVPPAAWIEDLSQRSGVPLDPEGPERFGDGVQGEDRLLLQFEGGPGLAVSARHATRKRNLHEHLHDSYAGPRQRQVVDVLLLRPDGSTVDVPRDLTAEYRAGVKDEAGVLREAPRPESDGPAWRIGNRTYETLEAFLDALGPEVWERDALAAMTAGGHEGAETTVADVVEAHMERLPEGLAAVLGSDTDDAHSFVAAHPNVEPRRLLGMAHEEAARRGRVASLPDLHGLGRLGAFLHHITRDLQADGRTAALSRLRQTLQEGSLQQAHLYACLQALGGDLALDARFDRDAKEAGKELAPLAEAVLESDGDSHREALARYLRDSGSGERIG